MRTRLEYCDLTLGDYIARNRSALSESVRKRVALQFLYGLNYLHSRGIIHRDISRRNVLIKVYDPPAVMVKLSDFGLAKEPESELTATDTSMKGTIIDPTLDKFGDGDELADIYAAGHLLSFIFSGKQNLGACSGEVQRIVERATTNDRAARFQNVSAMIAALEAIPVQSS